MDFKPAGALCIIFSAMYRYKSEQRWKKFDFTMHKVRKLLLDVNQMMNKWLLLLLDQFQKRSQYCNDVGN